MTLRAYGPAILLDTTLLLHILNSSGLRNFDRQALLAKAVVHALLTLKQ